MITPNNLSLFLPMIITPRGYTVCLMFMLMLSSTLLRAQQKATLSGHVRDAANGESLIGATVYVREVSNGTVTNVYGFYSLTVPPGEYQVTYSYVGYQPVTKKIPLTKDVRLEVELNSESQELEEIVVTSEGIDANVRSTEMSINKLDIKTIQKVPAFLGEVDVLRSIQLLPGVATVGEGASGFNVRGGGVGQNLILLDEAPVYNSSHLFGFFSVFNPDAVQDVKLYKGAIPAQYGGRISSLLDVRMKEGNNKEFDVSGGIGTVFSRLTVEGPIIKEKASFVVAARRSYIDVLISPFADQIGIGSDFGLYFYDLSLKTNYQINPNNRIFLSGYLGRDNFKFDERQGFNWGNSTATARWNHLFSSKLFSNFTFVFSDYDYELQFGEDDLDSFSWNSSVSNFIFKPQFSYFINSRNELSFGGEAIYYQFEPANAVGIADGSVIDISLDEKFNLETALYLSNKQDISAALSVEYGLRYSWFRYLGPGTVYTYGDAPAGVRRPVLSEETVDRGEPIATYDTFEPRASFKVQLDEQSSIKGSFTRMAQYLHLVSNTTASNPLDVWVPSSNNIEPQVGDQYALGFFRNFGSSANGVAADYEASLEGYYRDTRNQIDYIDGADLLINEFVEGDLLVGQGRAYGLELYLKKNTGKLNGWISYTLGKTELQVDGINRGAWYPTRFDQRHNLKVAAFYDINERWSVSGNFTYLTGTPATFPTSRFTVQGILIPYNANDSRNNTRIPDYHRLDLSVRLEGRRTRRNGKVRKNEDYWVFSLYNVYARRNPFSIYFSQDEATGPVRDTSGALRSSATQLSIVGSIIPSISYNFKF